jgi:hypothetical protein
MMPGQWRWRLAACRQLLRCRGCLDGAGPHAGSPSDVVVEVVLVARRARRVRRRVVFLLDPAVMGVSPSARIDAAPCSSSTLPHMLPLSAGARSMRRRSPLK